MCRSIFSQAFYIYLQTMVSEDAALPGNPSNVKTYTANVILGEDNVSLLYTPIRSVDAFLH